MQKLYLNCMRWKLRIYFHKFNEHNRKNPWTFIDIFWGVLPRLISVIPAAVAKAAMESGVARKNIDDFEMYKDQLKQRLDPTVTIMQGINSYIKSTCL